MPNWIALLLNGYSVCGVDQEKTSLDVSFEADKKEVKE